MRTKLMIYKAKSDGLHTYAIFQKGYKYKIFMCNDPFPNTYLAKRVLPIHARAMAFFENVEEKHYQRAMDNLYNADAFIKAAYNHEKN